MYQSNLRLGSAKTKSRAEVAVLRGHVRDHRIERVRGPDELEGTRAMLAGTPPPWLRKVLAGAGAGPSKPTFVDDE